MIKLLCLTLLFTGCQTIPSVSGRWLSAKMQAQSHSFKEQTLSTETFKLWSVTNFTEFNSTYDELTIYIEGDGFAWVDSNTISRDPTPIHAQALALALSQPAGLVAYLGRPCQYLLPQNQRCAQKYWTHARFSSEVVDAMNQAVSQLKEQAKVKKLRLVGYSGGATIAWLVAAKRKDVFELVSVAGNLDIKSWAERLRISPLNQSLNPSDFSGAWQGVRQVFWVGEQDKIIPWDLTWQFMLNQKQLQLQKYALTDLEPVFVKEASFSHYCCYDKSWPGFWKTYLSRKY